MTTENTPVFEAGTPVPLDVVVSQHRQLVSPDRPTDVRMRVARGLLPSTPEDLIPTLVYLAGDAVPEIAAAARQTLLQMPNATLIGVASAHPSPWAMDGFARIARADEELLRAVALNRHTDDATIAWLAGIGAPALCDVIGRNQVRSLRYPAIIESLYFNPRAPQGIVQGLLELAVREELPLDHMPGYKETRAALLGEGLEAHERDAPGLSEIEFMSVLAYDFGDIGEADDAEEKPRGTGLQALLLKMSVAQKVRLALVGDANARKLLIRDPKKLVSFAVLKSPRVTEAEIALFAGNKNLAEDIIAVICRRRTWTKDYTTRKALILNPKTPASFALGFLRTMNQRDLKLVSQSREISATVARQAKRILEQLTQSSRKK